MIGSFVISLVTILLALFAATWHLSSKLTALEVHLQENRRELEEIKSTLSEHLEDHNRGIF